MMRDLIGQQLGNYRLVSLLGCGGFAEVYLGQHVHIATQQAAIKLLHILDVDTKKFQHEAETTAALVHPHIIRLFDFDFHDQMPFLVIEYAAGGSLRSRHPEGIQVPLPTVVWYVQEIAEALEYAHSKNVIHCDIKPDNILIGVQGELRLSDFGIAKLSRTGRTSLAASSGIEGTIYYMAPEQSRGKPEKASDQYALGIMVYEWLCGKPPFSEGNAINIQYQHAYEPVPPLREQLPTLPQAIEQVIMRALAKEPHQRFATVQDFATTLKKVSQTKQSASTPPQPNTAAPQPKSPPGSNVFAPPATLASAQTKEDTPTVRPLPPRVTVTTTPSYTQARPLPSTVRPPASAQLGYWPPQGQGTPNASYPLGSQGGANGMGITGFVFGFLGIILIWIPSISVTGVISAILGIIFSAVSLRRAQTGSKGLAKAGFVLSLITTALSLCIVASLIASMSH